MNDVKYRYELSPDVVNYLITAVSRVQISGVQQAQSLLNVVEILQSPLNSEDIEKEQLEVLKGKYEKKESKK